MKIFNLFLIVTIMSSCSFFGRKGIGKTIKPSKKIFINYEWECSKNIDKLKSSGPYMVFGKGFRNDSIEIIVNNSIVYKNLLHTNESTGTSGSFNLKEYPENEVITIRINKKVYQIKWNYKCCYMFISNRFGIKVAVSKKYPGLYI